MRICRTAFGSQGRFDSRVIETANRRSEERSITLRIATLELLQANGTAERDAALLMTERIPGTSRVTVAGDKGYDTKDFVAELRQMNVTPHENVYGNRRH